MPIAENLIDYAVSLVEKTRLDKNLLDWGAGPRASSYLILAAKAKAIINGKATPDTEDIKSMMLPILRHRIIPSFNAEADGMTRDSILKLIIDESEK